MFPLARHLMARVYLLAALATGMVIGYVLGRVEAHFEISAITSGVQMTGDADATAADLDGIGSMDDPTIPEPEPLDDLEHAARRLDDRARRADRLGDPKLAEFWRQQAADLRQALDQRAADSGAQASAIAMP